MKKDTGGPAFPSLNAECTGLDSDGFERWDTEPSGGMMLRDYFAAKAMQGFITNFDTRRSDIIDVPELARSAYYLADAMIAERNK